ncbi:hypothetical protein [Salinicoccus sp. YB14-2]|uniref:hypothetical protein n=1 Tax=Salinicoccus sp. YB14-2 TaxID=1572701 RepID=UPI000689AADA|nr:hypothetical protein [Salinicoccus sp. YB14-2]
MFDESAFKSLIQDAVKEALSQQDNQLFHGYADVKQFIKISGISENDMERKVLSHPAFEHCVCRFDGSMKRYIHIRKGLDALDKILIKESI